MNLKLDLRIDTKSFVFLIIITALLFLLMCSTFGLRWFEVHNYSNCTIQSSPYDADIKYWSMPKCCYPHDCPESKNNPEHCSCIYPVECGD